VIVLVLALLAICAIWSVWYLWLTRRRASIKRRVAEAKEHVKTLDQQAREKLREGRARRRG
jgi:uncharacterized iron-regulated membrane protein